MRTRKLMSLVLIGTLLMSNLANASTETKEKEIDRTSNVVTQEKLVTDYRLLAGGERTVVQTYDLSVAGDKSVLGELDSNGLLTISGTGTLKTYTSATRPFKNDTRILCVDIKEGVKGELTYFFSDCTELQTVLNIPEGITSLNGTFYKCTKLQSVSNLPQSTTVMTNTFYECSSLLASPDIPSNVTALDTTFRGCTSLVTTPNIPNSVTKMLYTFDKCTALKTITNLPSNLILVNSTFSNCSSLVDIPAIPSTLLDLGHMFENCTSLVKMPVLSQGVQKLDFTFQGCSSLTETTAIPDSVISLSSTFGFCTSLVTAPDIPASVEKATHTFRGCTALKTGAKIADKSNCTRYDNMYQDCTSLVSVPDMPTLSKNTYTYTYYMFSNCSSLVTAPRLPDLLSGASNMFENCTSLTGDVYIPSTALTSVSNMFNGTEKPIKVYSYRSSALDTELALRPNITREEYTIFKWRADTDKFLTDVPKLLSTSYTSEQVQTLKTSVKNTRSSVATYVKNETDKADLLAKLDSCIAQLDLALAGIDDAQAVAKVDTFVSKVDTLLTQNPTYAQINECILECNALIGVINNSTISDKTTYTDTLNVAKQKLMNVVGLLSNASEKVSAYENSKSLNDMLSAYSSVKMLVSSPERTALESRIEIVFKAYINNDKTDESVRTDFANIIAYANSSSSMSKNDCLYLANLITAPVLKADVIDIVNGTANGVDYPVLVSNYAEKVASTQNNVTHDLNSLTELSYEGQYLLTQIPSTSKSLALRGTSLKSFKNSSIRTLDGTVSLEEQIAEALAKVTAEIEAINSAKLVVASSDSSWQGVKPAYITVVGLIPSAEQTALKTELWGKLTNSFATLTESEITTVFDDIKATVGSGTLTKADALDIAVLLPDSDQKDSIVGDINKLPDGGQTEPTNPTTPATDSGDVVITFPADTGTGGGTDPGEGGGTDPGEGGGSETTGSLVLTLDTNSINVDYTNRIEGADLPKKIGINVDSDASYSVYAKSSRFTDGITPLDKDILSASMVNQGITDARVYSTLQTANILLKSSLSGIHDYDLYLKLNSGIGLDSKSTYTGTVTVEVTQR